MVVTGAQRSDPAAVDAITASVLGVPLPAVDTGNLAGRLDDLPLVLDTEVTRSWPRTLTVRVVERQPAAAVPRPGGVDLVDGDGVVVETVSSPPAGLPVVTTDLAAGNAALAAALAVIASLPPELAGRVGAVTAVSSADIRLVIDGKDVRWGDAGQAAAKAAVASALLAGAEAAVYDVSAPQAPATRP